MSLPQVRVQVLRLLPAGYHVVPSVQFKNMQQWSGAGEHSRHGKKWKSGQAGLHLLELADNKRIKNGNLKCLHLASVPRAEEEHSGSFSFAVKYFDLIPFYSLLPCTALWLWCCGWQGTPLALHPEKSQNLAFSIWDLMKTDCLDTWTSKAVAQQLKG